MPDKVIKINESCSYYEIYYNNYWFKYYIIDYINFGYYEEFRSKGFEKRYYAR